MRNRELRRRWRAFFEEGRRLYEAWEASNFHHSMRPPRRSLPEELRGMTCGAKTRAGTPCKRRDLCDSGRCRLHGGMSTGPRTEEGKKRSSLNGLVPKKKRTS